MISHTDRAGLEGSTATSRPGHRVRRLVLVGAACVAILGTAFLGVRYLATAQSEPADSASTSFRTTSVVRTDLAQETALDGHLSFGDSRAVNSQLGGVITWLPDVAFARRQGDRLFEVDGEPILLLLGDRPTWRAMALHARGPDVRQLKDNLLALGYARRLTSNNTFDPATEAAVRKMQRDKRQEVDGVVDLGEVVVLPDAVRLATHEAAVGDTIGPGSPVVRVTTFDLAATALLPVDQRDLIELGDEVRVALANGTTLTGNIESIAPLPHERDDQSGDLVIDVLVGLSSQPTADLNGATVRVLVAEDVRTDVLAVRVEALLALANGRYGVEVLRTGDRLVVEVELGMFADGLVEVSGDISEGDLVVVPS